MPYHWPKDTDFARLELDVLNRDCPVCGRMMYICDHRYRHFHSLEGPVEMVCKLNHCPDVACLGHAKTISPELEITIALPKMAIGWDVFCWIGHRRFSRHWSITQIQFELSDQYHINISDDFIGRYIQSYQVMLAARQEDPETLQQQYKSSDEIILCIDGLQPEKGHETLYVVRELTQKRVWFAEALISATAEEVRRLINKAKKWAESLGKKVGLWLSDRQDAFVTGIKAEFPDVPHRYCDNHFLRDVAKPVLEMDSHAKVTMRKKVRGLRKIEQAVLKQRAAEAAQDSSDADAKPSASVEVVVPAVASPPQSDSGGAVVLDYCAAVRGIVNDDQGGPLHPPGLRMAEALSDVRESIQRNLQQFPVIGLAMPQIAYFVVGAVRCQAWRSQGSVESGRKTLRRSVNPACAECCATSARTANATSSDDASESCFSGSGNWLRGVSQGWVLSFDTLKQRTQQIAEAGKDERSEQVADLFPQIAFGLHLLPSCLEQRTASLLDLVHHEGQHHQQGEHYRQILLTVTEVVFQAITLVFQGVERFVLDLPTGTATTHDGVNRLGCQRHVGDPGEVLHIAIGMDFPIFEDVD